MVGGVQYLVFAVSVGFSLVTAHAESEVQLSVYYESMCPDSDLFVRQQLSPTYKKLSSSLKVDLVPYGNAYYKGKRDSYTFTCQHGPDECYGNTVQACFIELVNNTESQIKFVKCAFETGKQQIIMEKCISDLDLRRQVKKCVTSPMGGNLLYQNGKRTESLSPRQNFIPWITVDGKGDRSITERANEDLLSLVCENFSDDKPEACLKNKWITFQSFRSNYL